MKKAKLVEAHGSFSKYRCSICKVEHKADISLENSQSLKLPQCSICPEKGWIKPDITFFGEDMPCEYDEKIKEDCPKADLCLIMGTSLMVLDVCLLPNFVPKTCPRVVINMEPVGIFNEFSFFDEEDSGRDIFYPAKTDDACLEIADALDWKDILLKQKII